MTTIPQPGQLLDARQRAHREFDQLWISGRMSRTDAYTWLRKVLRVKKRNAHISKLTVDQCAKLIRQVKQLKPLPPL